MLVHQANEKMKNMYNPQEMLDRRLSVYTSILKDEFYVFVEPLILFYSIL